MALTLGAKTVIGTEDEPVLQNTGDAAVLIDANGRAISAGAKDVTLTHNGQIYVKIDNNGSGISVWRDSTGDTVITNNGMVFAPGHGIQAAHTGTGDVAVTHTGTIWASRYGILAYNSGTSSDGSVRVETGEGSSITSGNGGINASVRSAGAAGNVTVTHKGMIHRGPVTGLGSLRDGIHASIRGGGSLTGNPGARDAAAKGRITVTTGENSVVTAAHHGIRVWHHGSGEYAVAVRGRVTGGGADGDGNKYAGVYIEARTPTGDSPPELTVGGGGTIAVGARGYVGAESGVAVKVDDKTGKATVVLERDGKGLVGHIDGDILGAIDIMVRDGSGGVSTALSAGDAVDRRVGRTPLYTEVKTAALGKVTGGYRFTDTAGTRLLYDSRARVYEALPSVLLDVNAHAPRLRRDASGGNNVWAAFDAGKGERQAAGSTTSKGMAGALAWDFTRWGVASGFDFPAGEDLTIGVSAHHRRGKATVKRGGTVKAAGTGVGASLTYGSADAVYFRGWVSYSGFSGIELMSDDDSPDIGNLSRSDVSGSGNAIGVEAGMRTELEGMTLTPRGGFVFSSVDISEFSDLAGVSGSGKVSGSGRSFKGRFGVTAEIGEVAPGAAVYASLDAEHDFSAKRDVTASGIKLSSEPKATWGRLGLGGEISLSEDGGTMLSGEAYYATAGGGNSEFGGGLTLGFRF